MVVAIGEAATGVFSSSNIPWAVIESAGYYTGDRMWRFPLWNYYSSLIKGTLHTNKKKIKTGILLDIIYNC